MKRLTLILIALPVLIVLVILFPMTHWKTEPWKKRSSSTTPTATNLAAAVTAMPSSAPTLDGQPALLGETILAGYANTNLPPQNDLVLMSRLMDSPRPVPWPRGLVVKKGVKSRETVSGVIPLPVSEMVTTASPP